MDKVVLFAVCMTGTIKGAAAVLGMSRQSAEYHLRKMGRKLNMTMAQLITVGTRWTLT